MKRRENRRVFLGFEWEAGSWDDALLLCDYLFKRLDRRPVHWNLPAFPADSQARKRASLVRQLRSRVEGSGDRLTSMGFAGACHPLLNLDELEKELSWGLKNPWGTGVADLFGVRPRILVPRVPDLARKDAWSLYAAHGFPLVGISEASGGYRRGEETGYFRFTRIPVASTGNGDPAFRSARRRFAGSDDMFLMLDLSGLTGQGRLETVLDQLAGPLLDRDGGSLSLLEEPPLSTGQGAGPLPGCRSDWSPIPVPVLRTRIEAAAGYARRKRKKTEEYQDLLFLLARGGTPGGQAGREKQCAQNELRLVAHMLGDVALTGKDFDVRLSGGRFCGITRRGIPLLPVRPAVSYIRAGGRMMPFRTLSSFSFESEEGTGLREELGLEDGKGSSLSIEYSFCDDSPLLSVTAEATWPQIPGSRVVEEYAPLAIALSSVARGATVLVEAKAPDESLSSAVLSENGGGVLLPGSHHRIRRDDGGWIVVRFAPREGRKWGLPSFRVARSGGRRFLEMNPFGSYAPMPSAALSGRKETFTLLIGLEDA
jgi:hypothetical protein